MTQKKKKIGRKPLPADEKKFRVETWVSESDIAQDDGVKCWKASMNRAMDKRIIKKTK